MFCVRFRVNFLHYKPQRYKARHYIQILVTIFAVDLRFSLCYNATTKGEKSDGNKRVIHRASIKICHSTQLVKNTFKDAYETRQPKGTLIFHSDRGGNYRSKTFCNYLKYLKVTQSFSRAYTPYDNSVVESFFSSLKREELYRTKYRSDKEFKKAVDEYMVFYNSQRPHSNNNYRTPDAKEAEYYSKNST